MRRKEKRRKDKNLIQAMPPTNNGRAKNLSEQIILRGGTCVFQASRNGASWHRDKKNGIPLYPNLVNLKSNTMKNTMQRYGLFRKMQALAPQKCIYARKFNNITLLIAHFFTSCAVLSRFCLVARHAPHPPHGDEKTTIQHHKTNKPTIKHQLLPTPTPPPQHEPSFLNKQ